MSARALVTNFAYGTGPYLRTTELALAFNDQLEARGQPRMAIIVPWVYGEKQRRIMLEEFGQHAHRQPEEILLDPVLGGLLREVFYSGAHRYEEALARWLASAETVSERAHQHLRGQLELETLAGTRVSLHGSCIALELNRSPRIFYDVAPAYSTTFGYVADILERAASLPAGVVDVAPDLLRRGVALADAIEGARQSLHCMAVPATFSWDEAYVDRYDGTLVPPLTGLPTPTSTALEQPGIFVTVTGIEGLERLYDEARKLGLRLYSNDPAAVPGSSKALPACIGDEQVKLHFARAGWGSLWLSLFLGSPILVPEFDRSDDPEIYFNNLALEQLGFGLVYSGQPLHEVLAAGEACRVSAQQLRDKILGRWGILSGNEICASILAARFARVSEST